MSVNPQEIIQQFRAKQAELDAFIRNTAAEHRGLADRLADLEQKRIGYAPGAGAGAGRRSLASVLLGDAGVQSLAKRASRSAGVEVKAADLFTKSSPPSVITNDGATMSQPTRWPDIVGGAERQAWLRERMEAATTNASAIDFTQETAFVNGAASQAGEGVTKAETEFGFGLENRPVRTVAHYVAASRQVLDDSPTLGVFLDRRLRYGLEIEVERQILNGDPTQHELTGLMRSGQHIAFTPSTGDQAIDSVRRAMAGLQARDFYGPYTLIINPADWSVMETAKDEEQRYLIGSPRGQNRPTLWGADVHATNAMTAGQFVLADLPASCVLFNRQDGLVELSDSDGDNFRKNLVTVRAELRLALAVVRPAGVAYGDLTL